VIEGRGGGHYVLIFLTRLVRFHISNVITSSARVAAGYHITNVESHKPGKEDQYVMAATATFYHINSKAAYG